MTAHTLIAVDPEQLSRIERKLDLLLQAEPPDDWLTIEQACEELGVSDSTVRRRAREGEIEAKGRGKMRRFKI